MASREYHRNYSRNFYHKRKQKLLDILGNKCVKCGSIEELQFDHIDHENKNFTIGRLLNHKWEKILQEVTLCQLLCRWCHEAKTRTEGSLLKNKKIGEEVSGARLTEEQVIEIRKSKLGCRKLSRIYNVDRGTIAAVKRYKTWKHVV